MGGYARALTRRLSDKLRRLAARAAQVPSLGYAVAYLAAIPVFALFYFVLALDFYNSTARYEPMVEEQSTEIGDRLRQTYLADGKGNHQKGVTVPLLYGKPVSESPYKSSPTFDVRLEPGQVQIVVHQFVEKPQRDESWLVIVALDIDKNARNRKPDFSDPEFATRQYVTATPHVISGVNVNVSALFPCGDMEGAACLRMTLADEVLLLALADTASGRPWQQQNSFVRMLYFSAVTISTLGYGDIVPVTSRARLLVTVEAILGPLLFGLFLNSLVKEGAEHIQAKIASERKDVEKFLRV
jgi:hypothetical protein